jgi:Cu+-exporting ATPase
MFAGGKQMGKVIEMEVLNSVSQSYLTQLEQCFQKRGGTHKTITDTISILLLPCSQLPCSHLDIGCLLIPTPI